MPCAAFSVTAHNTVTSLPSVGSVAQAEGVQGAVLPLDQCEHVVWHC